MSKHFSAFLVGLLLTTLHCAIGNVVGVATVHYMLIDILFLPYSFIAGMSAFAGWDALSLLLELIGFGIMLLVFYPVGLIITRKRKA